MNMFDIDVWRQRVWWLHHAIPYLHDMFVVHQWGLRQATSETSCSAVFWLYSPVEVFPTLLQQLLKSHFRRELLVSEGHHGSGLGTWTCHKEICKQHDVAVVHFQSDDVSPMLHIVCCEVKSKKLVMVDTITLKEYKVAQCFIQDNEIGRASCRERVCLAV